MRKFIIDVSKANYRPVSDVLLSDPRFNPTQKLFLLKLVNMQADGIKPFLSQSEFAKQNRIRSRTTISNEVKELVEQGFIYNLGQGEEKLACYFIVNSDFMAELGYVPLERYKADEATTSTIPANPSPTPIEAPVELPNPPKDWIMSHLGQFKTMEEAKLLYSEEQHKDSNQ